jgi:hypothetical protein
MTDRHITTYVYPFSVENLMLIDMRRLVGTMTMTILQSHYPNQVNDPIHHLTLKPGFTIATQFTQPLV